MTLGDYIKSYRQEHGLSQRSFAAQSGLSNGYISMVEKGENPATGEPIKPTLIALKKIASGMGITLAVLISRCDDIPVDLSQELPDNVLPMPKTVKKPRLGTIACGRPILAVEEAGEFDDVPEEVHCDFTLLCKGDSMINARIFDGDIVYIRSQERVENGQIAAVRINDEATLKKVYYTPGSDRITLRACNPLYPDMVYEGEELSQMKILGLAVGFYSDIRNEQ